VFDTPAPASEKGATAAYEAPAHGTPAYETPADQMGRRRARARAPGPCIHPTEHEPDFAGVRQLFIDPDECIDCDACVEVCPVDAIFADDQLPEVWEHFTKINSLCTSASVR
jgi:NAD-dependent dihydropyrimidine dehydrogenase PreA subunit